MSTASSNNSALNEKRRLAVKLRLEGRKLKEVSELVELSPPTIIAAYKLFKEGGWPAVDVKPRGRPSGDKAPAGDALLQLQADAFAQPKTSHSPWSFKLLGEQLPGMDTGVRTIGKYVDTWGLAATDLFKQCKSDGLHLDWLNTQYKAITSSARKSSTNIYWAGSNTCEYNNAIQPFVYAHSTRGQYFWLAGNYPDDAARLIDFLSRLQKQAGKITPEPETAGTADSKSTELAIIWRGHDPHTVPAVREWLQQTSGIAIHLHPDNQSIPHSAGSTSQRNPLLSDNNACTESGATTNKAKAPQTTTRETSQPVPTAIDTDTNQQQSRNEATATNSKSHNNLNLINKRNNNPMSLTHLQRLEAESIHILREVVAEADNPVMLYSIGKDSAVMLHLAKKAFYPAKPPFPLLHVDTGWKFQAMYDLRDKAAKEAGMRLIVHKNPEGVEKGVNPFTHGSALHTEIMKTDALKQALNKHEFDVAIGGARRDEEKSRAKERVLSFRTAEHHWDPKNQRPELWNLYNTAKKPGESIRAFPLSNWTELDIWQYIHKEDIAIVPLYLAAERPVVLRDGTWIMVDDDRMPMNEGEVPVMKRVRFRTLGCYPLTGAIESTATTIPEVIEEMLVSNSSERQGRMIDHDSSASMEKKKQEGYF